MNIINNKPVDALAGALLCFKRPTRPHRTATVPIIGSRLWDMVTPNASSLFFF